MALVVFIRGVNVGGHRTFRPSVLARVLSDYGVVNVGAAGTFVVRKPGLRNDAYQRLIIAFPLSSSGMKTTRVAVGWEEAGAARFQLRFCAGSSGR